MEWRDRILEDFPGSSRYYAERLAPTKFRHFLGGPVWVPGNRLHITDREFWEAPPKWASESRRTGAKIMVVNNSLYDLFEDHPTIDDI